MMRGIRYSPLEGSLAVSISIVPAVFMAEFQAMFAMYMNRVSIGYGSPLWALVITRCNRPWAASGASQENALSMRKGRPSGSIKRSSGPGRKAGRGAGHGLARYPLPHLARGLRTGGDRFGIGRLVAKAAGRIEG